MLSLQTLEIAHQMIAKAPAHSAKQASILAIALTEIESAMTATRPAADAPQTPESTGEAEAK